MLRDIPSRDVDSADTAGDRETLVDRYCVRDTVAGVEDYTRSASRGVEG